MYLVRETFLLFGLNLLDALLDADLSTKRRCRRRKPVDGGIAQYKRYRIPLWETRSGAIAAVVLLKWGYYRIAKVGVAIALVLYVGLMGIHLLTGLTAAGMVSNGTVSGTFAFFKPVIALFFGYRRPAGNRSGIIFVIHTHNAVL
ncbi:MAG: hypothetical protein IPM21_10875 [Acidobacteria bacterium]|nr:hypothetical protein [Acidobacteriota bacterium]